MNIVYFEHHVTQKSYGNHQIHSTLETTFLQINQPNHEDGIFI